MEWWNFWWIIFPLMGVAGGAAKAWERGARARHERRLEVMRAKAELRVARTGAIATAPAAAPAPEAPHRQQLQKLFAAHDEVTHRWLDYELDVAKLIAFPAMSDGRQPLTAAFLRAKKIADGLRPDSVDVRIAKDQLAEYRAAVTDYEVAFDVAERDARRIRDSSFSDSERKRLDTAKQLLTVAIDQAATPAERQLAYRRVREELDGLISVSDEAIDVLEKKVALELTTGTTDAEATRQAASTTDAVATTDAGVTTPVTERQPVPPASPRPSSAAPATTPGRVVHPKPLR